MIPAVSMATVQGIQLPAIVMCSVMTGETVVVILT